MNARTRLRVKRNPGDTGQRDLHASRPSRIHVASQKSDRPGRGEVMKRFIAVLAVVSTLTAAALAAPSASAAARSSKRTAVSNGKIVFRQWLNGKHTRGEIFTINPDGTGLFQVTHTPKGASTEPDPSP